MSELLLIAITVLGIDWSDILKICTLLSCMKKDISTYKRERQT